MTDGSPRRARPSLRGRAGAAACAALLPLLLLAAPGRAATLDRIAADKTVRCAAVARAGFADAKEDGTLSGVGIDLCRALARAVQGEPGIAAFDVQDSAAGLAHPADLVFATAGELREAGLAGRVIPGGAVFVTELTVLAKPGITDLAGQRVCFMNGSLAHQALEDWATRTGTPILRSGFQEDGEMLDAFDAGRCGAMAGEAAVLAEIQSDAPFRAGAHLLPALGVMPVFAAVPAADGAWAAASLTALASIVRSEREPGPWRSDLPGADAPGLRPGWQAEVLARIGSYAEMMRRAGAGTANAPWPQGLLLPFGPG